MAKYQSPAKQAAIYRTSSTFLHGPYHTNLETRQRASRLQQVYALRPDQILILRNKICRIRRLKYGIPVLAPLISKICRNYRKYLHDTMRQVLKTVATFQPTDCNIATALPAAPSNRVVICSVIDEFSRQNPHAGWGQGTMQWHLPPTALVGTKNSHHWLNFLELLSKVGLYSKV